VAGRARRARQGRVWWLGCHATMTAARESRGLSTLAVGVQVRGRLLGTRKIRRQRGTLSARRERSIVKV
jgi:hypothetical protein